MAENQVQQPSVDDAHRLLHDEIHMPVFFEKLASDYGIRPRNEDEAQKLLEMGAYLFAVQEREKAAAADPFSIDAGYDSLCQVLGQHGIPSPSAVQQEQAIKSAAHKLA